ncbi:MAG: hypothetical protein WCF71_12805 [Verrucomicrobiia bacterium]
MKTDCYQTTRPVEIKTHSPSRMKIKFGSALPALLLAGMVLLGPGWGVPRCAAGVGFPTAVTNEVTMSAAVFQLVIDPGFTNLFYPVSSSTFYPGYSPASGVLTSPMLFQYPTWIGTSVSHVRNTSSPGYFPATVGDSTASPNPPAATIANYAQFALIPPPFSTAPSGPAGVGVDEIFTEIEDLDMIGISSGSTGLSNSVCTDPRMPPEPPVGMVVVAAGPLAIPGLPQNLRSIGIVQQITPGGGATSDFPAQSFYDVFVEVTLPQLPLNGSMNFPSGGAVLYNDASDPLIVQNLSISNLPPTVAYTHSAQSTAVPVKFLTSNPPYWTAGDVLGYLTLAGHGVFSNATTVTVCDRVTDPGGLLDVTLGPVGSPLPGAPIPWLRPTNLFPMPDTSGGIYSTYNSSVNTFVDPSTGLTNILDDTVSFTTASGTYFVRDLSLPFTGIAGNPWIQPPQPNNPSSLSVEDNFVTIALSSTNYYGTSDYYSVSTSATSTLLITNTGTSGNTTSYATELEQTDFPITGYIVIRVNTSPGQYTIKPDPRGYRVSSYFDLNLQLTDDGGETWADASHTLRVQPIMPPAAPNSIFVTGSTKTNVTLNWQNSFTLQSAPTVTGPYTDLTPSAVSGPFPVTISSSQQYFRLRQ